ncbi:hypothetical protein [Streptomyces sp. Da 82-17]|uniref:hypothetical protein n=1 Tax=Streptomyces sp. Da 82-17 TaxID=3377116 RepID=UPI0038D40CB1
MAANPLHTDANAVPSIDDTDLGDVLADLSGIHPGLDLIADGLRLIAHDRHSRGQTQTISAALAGTDSDAVTAIAFTLQRLADPDTNPSLRELPLDQQKLIRLAGEQTAYALTDPDLHQPAANIAAAIDGH